MKPIPELTYVEQDRGHSSPCWITTWKLDANGYGSVARSGKRFFAHRLSFEKVYGPLLPGEVVHHECEIRPCIRPDHLRKKGGQSEHIAGHNRKIPLELEEKIVEELLAGVPQFVLVERHEIPQTTLTSLQKRRGIKVRPFRHDRTPDELKQQILREVEEGNLSQNKIAKKYGVGSPTITHWRRGRRK